MLNIKEAIRRLQRSVERSWRLYGLSHEGNQTAESISPSVRGALKGNWTREERGWIDRIERLRAEMNASSAQLTRTDYGAGSPESHFTPEQMQAGVDTVDTVGHISRAASKPPFWCGLLFELIRTVHPTSCIEMGTAVGISAAYQGAALRLNGDGGLVTLEGAKSLATIAENNLQGLGLDTVDVVVGRFQDTLPEVLATRRPVDYVFVDGHHDERATLAYFEQILPFLADIALVVFDDIAWSDGMKRAWHRIAHYNEVEVAVDLGPVGLCVIDRYATQHRYFRIPLN
jgi:predicted O-methyltransferase YrrM